MNTLQLPKRNGSLSDESRLYPLREALKAAGITAPTYYRWLKAGKIVDRRVRGKRGTTLLPADALETLRQEATKVKIL